MLFRRFLLVVHAFLLLSILALPASSQEAEWQWSAPERLGPGWFPSIAVDRTDRAHVGWHQANLRSQNDLWLYVSRSPTDTENLPPIDALFTGVGGYTIRSGMDITSEGMLHVAYRAGSIMNYASAAADKAYSAQSWTNPKTFPENIYYVDLLVDRNDVLHNVTSQLGVNLIGLEASEYNLGSREQSPCLACSDIVYKRSEDEGKSWSQSVNLSDSWEGSEQPRLIEGPSGRLYVAWSEGHDWYAGDGDYQDGRFRYSDDGGLTWSDTFIFAGDEPDAHPFEFMMTEGLDQLMLVVWRYDSISDSNIYYQTSDDNGQTWSPPAAIDGIEAETVFVSDLDHYELITDLTGVIHLFAVGYDPVTGLGPALYHAQFRQGRWYPPEVVFYDSRIDKPEWPVADIGPQNDIHLAWFTRSRVQGIEADLDDVYVYYSRRTGDLPNRTVLEAYPPTPTEVVVAVMPTFAPTATPLATVAPIDPDVSLHGNNDLYAIQSLLGGIGAVALLGILIMLLRGYRPRFF